MGAHHIIAANDSVSKGEGSSETGTWWPSWPWGVISDKEWQSVGGFTNTRDP